MTNLSLNTTYGPFQLEKFVEQRPFIRFDPTLKA